MTVQGTWTNPLTGNKIKDYGVTEKITKLFGSQGSTQPTTFYNPAAAQKNQIGSAVYAPTTTTTISGPQSQAIQTPAPYIPTSGNTTDKTNTTTTKQTSNNFNTAADTSGRPTAPEADMIPDSERDAIYNPLIAAANERYNTLQSQIPGYLKDIENTGETQKQPFEERLTEGTKELTTQEQQTRDAEKSAIAQARKLFNELKQYNLARFGSGSSAGQATMELLGRSTSGNIGQATDTAQKNVAIIKDNLIKLGNFVTQQKSNIDKEVESKKTAAKQWFQERLDQINADKAMLESQKAQARYSALAQVQAYNNQIAATNYNYQNELYNWQKQRQSELEETLRSSADANPSETDSKNVKAIEDNMIYTAPVVRGPDGQDMMINQQGAYERRAPLGRKYGLNPDTNRVEWYTPKSAQIR